MNTLKDFYYFYKEIPEEKWCTDKFEDEQGRCCAFGHVGKRIFCEPTVQFTNLCQLLGKKLSLASVNDGIDENYPQFTPKQRVLAFLIDMINEKEDSTFKG